MCFKMFISILEHFKGPSEGKYFTAVFLFIKIPITSSIIFIYISIIVSEWESCEANTKSTTHESPVCRVSTHTHTPHSHTQKYHHLVAVRVASISHVKSSFASSHNLPLACCK